MGHDEDILALSDVAEDGALKEGYGALLSHFEGFAVGGRHVVAAAPDVDLLFAVFGAHVVFVESGEVTVIAFVQCEIADGRDVQGDGFEDEGEGSLGAGEGAGVGDIEAVAAQTFAGTSSFFLAFGGEGHVHPAGEAVFEIPEGLAVSNESELWHRG